MKSYENAIRYLAKEEAAIALVTEAKRSNSLAGAHEIAEVLGNQLHDMLEAQKEHTRMVAYIYDKSINVVFRDMVDATAQL